MIKKFLLIIAAFAMLAAVSSCDDKKTSKSANKPEIKTGVKPVPDDEIAVIEMENPAYRTIKIELYSNIAPETVKRFKELAKSGFYNGVTFHRVSPFVIQGGDPNSKDNDPTNDGAGNSGKPNLNAEFSDIPFERGIVGAARKTDVNSANSQFFITLKRMQNWDKNYTVFGKVIDGMNNADTISGVPTDENNPQFKERPLENVVIKSITFQPRQ